MTPRQPRLKSPRDLADETNEPIGFTEAGALAIAGVHEAVARTAQKIADGGRKLARKARQMREPA